MRIFILTLAVALALAAPLSAQQAPNPDHIPPDNIRWQDSGWTMDLGGAFAFAGTTFDLDPTGNYTLDMDAATTLTLNIAPNLAAAYVLQDTAGADFINIDTTGDTMSIGNATTNPAFTLLGTGTLLVPASLDVNGSLDWDAATAAEIVTFNTTDVATTTGLVTMTDLRAGVNNDVIAEATLRIDTTGTFAVDITNGAFNSAEALHNELNVGTAGASGTATEYGNGYHHTTVITGISIADSVTSTGTELVGDTAYTFPEGAIVVHSVMFDGKVFSVTVTDTATAFAVGTTEGNGALATTEQDLMLTGALDGAITTTPGVTHTDVTLSSLNGAGVTPAFYDGTGGAIVAMINCTDTSWNAADTVTITGTLTIVWEFVGDF